MELIKNVFKDVNLGVYVTDKDNDILWYNDKLLRLSDYSRDEFLKCFSIYENNMRCKSSIKKIIVNSIKYEDIIIKLIDIDNNIDIYILNLVYKEIKSNIIFLLNMSDKSLHGKLHNIISIIVDLYEYIKLVLANEKTIIDCVNLKACLDEIEELLVNLLHENKSSIQFILDNNLPHRLLLDAEILKKILYYILKMHGLSERNDVIVYSKKIEDELWIDIKFGNEVKEYDTVMKHILEALINKMKWTLEIEGYAIVIKMKILKCHCDTISNNKIVVYEQNIQNVHMIKSILNDIPIVDKYMTDYNDYDILNKNMKIDLVLIGKDYDASVVDKIDLPKVFINANVDIDRTNLLNLINSKVNYYKYSICIAANDEILHNISAILKLNKFKSLDECNNGVKALSLLEHKKYDVVFLDVRLSVLDGIDTFRKIKNKYHKDRPKVIMIIVNALDNSKLELIKGEGIEGYIVYPFLKDDVYSELDKVLGN